MDIQEKKCKVDEFEGDEQKPKPRVCRDEKR